MKSGRQGINPVLFQSTPYSYTPTTMNEDKRCKGYKVYTLTHF
jgi:hypothetical protein